MKEILRKNINWEKTGKKIQKLREHNLKMSRYACYACHFNEGNCAGECEICGFEKDLDNRIIREELAKVFGTSSSVIGNWETGRTPVPIEDLLYCQITGESLEGVIVFG